MTEKKPFLSRYGIRIGISLSVAYAAIAIYILWPNLTYLLYFNLNDLSKLGGYLSGVFSPLAFIWLMYGYLIQKRSIEETRDISAAQIAYTKIKERNQYQPILIIKSTTRPENGNRGYIEFEYEILRAHVFDVKILRFDGTLLKSHDILMPEEKMNGFFDVSEILNIKETERNAKISTMRNEGASSALRIASYLTENYLIEELLFSFRNQIGELQKIKIELLYQDGTRFFTFNAHNYIHQQ